MNNDNQIMNLLSDIDVELIDDVLEIPQSPESGIKAVKATHKSIFAKFALPIAACLVMAAVSVAALIISGRNTDIPFENQTSQTTSAPSVPSDSAFKEVSDEVRAECESYIADELDLFQRMGCTYSCCGIDLNFDGVDEIALYPVTNLGSVFFFEKTEEGYKQAGLIDIESLYALNRFEDLRLYDKDGKKYYYYYYFGTNKDNYEEKGIAKLQLDENGIITESLLSYAGYTGGIRGETSDEYPPFYHKKGEDYINPDEFISLWSEYEGIPPYRYEEYWENGTVSLENAPLLSDLIKDNALPNIDGSFTYGIKDSFYFNFNYEGTVSKVILSQKDCGENKISLLGYKVRTDSYYDSKMIAAREYKSGRILFHRLMLVLSDKNDNILSFKKLNHYPSSSLEFIECDFPLNYMEDCLEAVDFGENQVIFYRWIKEEKVFQNTMLFAVKENQILSCLCTTNGDLEEPWGYMPEMSALYSVDRDSLSITDKISNMIYQFNFSESNESVYFITDVYYNVSEKSNDTLDLAEYTPFEASEIPFIPESGSYAEKAEYVMENALPKVLFAQKTITEGGSVYTLNLIAERVWKYIGSHSPVIYSADLRTAVFKDGLYLGSIVKSNGIEFFWINEDDKFEDYFPDTYYCEEYNALLLIKKNPAVGRSCGQNCFAAVNKDALYSNLYGSYDNIWDNKPDWADTVEDQIFYQRIEVKGNTLTCGYFVYKFNFDDENFGTGQSDFNISWRETSPDE